jgi:DNA-binding response OmpR family regulator
MPTTFDPLQSVASIFGIGEPLRVLVVEDNPDLARVLTMLLRHFGFEVQTLHDGQLVIATARSFRPHFILLDINLPVINGFEIAELIRSDPSFNNVVIIITSAYSPDMYRDRMNRARIDHYLTKPVQFDELIQLLVPRFTD